MAYLNHDQEIIGTDVLDHLGLVAATIDKLELSKKNRCHFCIGQ